MGASLGMIDLGWTLDPVLMVMEGDAPRRTCAARKRLRRWTVVDWCCFVPVRLALPSILPHCLPAGGAQLLARHKPSLFIFLGETTGFITHTNVYRDSNDEATGPVSAGWPITNVSQKINKEEGLSMD